MASLPIFELSTQRKYVSLYTPYVWMGYQCFLWLKCGFVFGNAVW